MKTVDKREFFLIRHAESMGNIGLDTGYDPLLSPLGHAQAKQSAEFMKQFCNQQDTLILASPFNRCLITAEEIAKTSNLTFQIVTELQEFFQADWFPIKKISFESLKLKAERYIHITGNYDNSQWWPEKNETLDEFSIRMAIFRNKLTGNTFSSKKIVLIGHWASIQQLAQHMVPTINMNVVKNGAVTKINYINGKFQTEFINKLCLQD